MTTRIAGDGALIEAANSFTLSSDFAQIVLRESNAAATRSADDPMPA
jgi:hypothetical protein